MCPIANSLHSRCYQLLDRRLRKKIRNVYMVHPTFWVKSLVFMSRPFISSKFWRKLVYVKNLEELYALVPSVVSLKRRRRRKHSLSQSICE